MAKVSEQSVKRRSMRWLFTIASVAVLLTGCAEFFGSRSKDAELSLQLPSLFQRDVKKDAQRVIILVGKIAEEHGLTRVAELPTSEGKTLYVVPGYAAGPWPGQPDVEWGGPTWKVAVERPGRISDTVACSVLPPRTGRVLKIMVWTHYDGRVPARTSELWQEVKTAVENEFGPQAILELKELK